MPRFASTVDYSTYSLAGLVLLFILTAVVYYPGLESRFILDDTNNLIGLEKIPTYGIGHYVFLGDSGPSGRWLTLFSFALQHQDWPSNPFAFKLVNLLIHILNGGLVFLLTQCLLTDTFSPRTRHTANKRLKAHQDSRTALSPRTRHIASFLITGLWLLHPMQVSTILYVIQRMTLMASTFILLGILLYLHARQVYQTGKTGKGLFLMCLSVGAFAPAAILNKEIGILLPLYILVIEFTLLDKVKLDRKWRLGTALVLCPPLLLVIAYIAYTFPGFATISVRPFSLGQRLLTQPRVLFDYLNGLIAPHINGFSVYHDDYPISTDLLTPLTTSLSLALLIILFVSALMLRRRFPVPSFAILWFLAGHSLESSFINLELYFEHRNYLPSFGIMCLLVYFLLYFMHRFSQKWIVIVPVLYFFLIISITSMEANLWSKPYLQAEAWVRAHPTSKRAINNLWNLAAINGDRKQAEAIYQLYKKTMPDDFYPELRSVADRYCYFNESMTGAEWQAIYRRAQESRPKVYGARIGVLDGLIEWIEKGRCNFPELAKLEKLVLLMAKNPAYKSMRGFLYGTAANIAVIRQDASAAIRNMETAVKYYPSLGNKIFMMRIYYAAGLYDNARSILKDLDSAMTYSPKLKLRHGDTLQQFRQLLAKQSHNNLAPQAHP